MCVSVAGHKCNIFVLVFVFKKKKKILIQGHSEPAEMTSGESFVHRVIRGRLYCTVSQCIVALA